MYKVTIGLEVHCELQTISKVFSGSVNGYDDRPNTNISAPDLGFPGILPVPNEDAVKKALKVSLALNCKTPDEILFDRKNYYYPDLPKGYQITQITKPVGIDGHFDVDVNGEIKTVLIHDIHLEEDTASLDHFDNYSLIDYNRSGVPLIETVTEPCLHSADEALAFLESLRSLIIYCGVSEARSDKGQMRCDVNISLSKTDKLGKKVEIKNINSFYSVRQAIEQEIIRQTEALDNNEEIIQETRRFDEETGTTIRMRSKVDGVDYKYYIDSNMPPIKLANEYLGEIRKTIPMLQLDRVNKYINEYQLSKYDSVILAKTKEISDFFDECITLGGDPKAVTNWLNGMILSYLNTNELTISDILIKPNMVLELIKLVEGKTISSKQAKDVITECIKTGKSPKDIVEDLGMKQITDDNQIYNIIQEVLKENDKEAREYTEEKNRMIDFFVGQVMKKTKGKANPSLTMKMLKEELIKYKEKN